VNHVDEFQSGDVLKFEMHGGGGTDFRPPFNYIEQYQIKPACFIYLTDGYGTFPQQAPQYPVLWCITTDVVAPWGQTIRIED
jgi:predicted metal-dependent peptidase